jgi:hypothetical protein
VGKALVENQLAKIAVGNLPAARVRRPPDPDTRISYLNPSM